MCPQKKKCQPLLTKSGFLGSRNEGWVHIGYILLWRVHRWLGWEPRATNVYLILGILQHKVVGVLKNTLLSLVIKVTDVAQANHAVQRKAKATGGGKSCVPAIAVDGFPSPRPKVKVDIIVLQLEVDEALQNALISLFLQSCLADKVPFLK